MTFKVMHASKVKSKAKIGIAGPAGAGKTFSALSIGTHFGRVAVIDTENQTSALYSPPFNFDIVPFDAPYSPSRYVEAITYAESLPVDLIVVDSLTHAWAGVGGALEMVDDASRRYSGNRYAAWRDVTPAHNRLVDKLVRCSKHLIVTVRSRQAYEMDRDATGRTYVRKLGMAPIQREGLDFEFDIAGDIDMDHNWVISKTRCTLLDGKTFHNPGRDVAMTILQWLNEGVDPLEFAENEFLSKYKLSNWSEAESITGLSKPTTLEEWQTADIIMEGSV